MNDNIKRYILVILSAFMCENLFLGVIPSLPTVIIMIFVQILCLSIYNRLLLNIL